jgi:RNA recognition motif-containing protein
MALGVRGTGKIKAEWRLKKMKLYVGNLAYSVTDRELHDIFAPVVGVTKAEVVQDRDTGRSKGFGFVELVQAEDAQIAIEELDGKEVSGRELRVQIAKPKENNGRGHGAGGRRGLMG